MAEPTHPYVVEDFDDHERAVLRRYVSNVDEPVFALHNLPEVVKGALFARYSRSPKSLRRLLLDEFAADLAADEGLAAATDTANADRPDAVGSGPPSDRAERLYERVFMEYGDDSVAQLGGAHLAVEQVSNLATKVLERGRLAAYLEQSTRYMPYDDKPGGRYRYLRPPEIMASDHAAAYESTLDAVFDIYAQLVPTIRTWAAERFPRDDGTSERAWRSALTAKTCDVLRGLLPAATVSNVGIFASGQAYESMLLRLRSHELAEARHIGDRMLTELRTVIPAFLTRVDRPDRGEVWGRYLADTRAAVRTLAADQVGDEEPAEVAEVTLTSFDPDAEIDVVAGALYPFTDLPDAQLRAVAAGMTPAQRFEVLRTSTGDRSNRRHKPGRAWERAHYRFDICSDYGAFRDLQRHRMLTIEWQELSCRHGYVTPAAVAEAGVREQWDEAMALQAALWERLLHDLPRAAQYAVGFAWNVRYCMELNARAAMQMLELRTTPQGHESYRRICQQMHTQIAETAGHRAIADSMQFVDHSAGELERLEAERALDRRRARSGR